MTAGASRGCCHSFDGQNIILTLMRTMSYMVLTAYAHYICFSKWPWTKLWTPWTYPGGLEWERTSLRSPLQNICYPSRPLPPPSFSRLLNYSLRCWASCISYRRYLEDKIGNVTLQINDKYQRGISCCLRQLSRCYLAPKPRSLQSHGLSHQPLHPNRPYACTSITKK